jgi:hypothetical protein
MTRPKRLNDRTSLNGVGQQINRRVQASGSSQCGEALESLIHFARKGASGGGNCTLGHRLVASWVATVSPSAIASVTATGAGRGGVRRGLRCDDTARPEAASFELEVSKFS